MKDLKSVGKSINRVDGAHRVTGIAQYCGDIKLPGMLEGALLYSPYPFANIKHIDVSAARDLPGVCAVVTGEDYPYLYGSGVKDRPVMALNKVRFTGEIIAAVAAETEAIAREACRLIRVQYEPLQPLLDPIQSMEDGEHLLHEDFSNYVLGSATPVPGTNICSHYKLRKGDMEKGFADADLIVEGTYQTPAVQHGQIEPHISIADYDPYTERLTIWTSTVAPYNARREISDIWNIPMNRIRVITPAVGGSFGGKMYVKTELYAVALSLKTKCPVRVMISREEEFGMAVRGASVTTIRSGVKKDGTITAREVSTVWDTGTYADCGPVVCYLSGHASPGPYCIPNSKVDGYTVYTNKNISVAYRGYGVQETAFAYESHMDEIAHRLKMDPVQLRLKNALRVGDAGSTGQIIDCGGLVECIELVAKEMDWDGFDQRVRRVEECNGRKIYRGHGIAAIHKGTGNGSWDCAHIRMNEDASSYLLLMSVIEQGQGSTTAMAQMAAEAMNIDVSQIHVVPPDTDTTPFDAGTTGSRATFCQGNTIIAAAEDFKRQLRELGGKVLGCEPGQVEFDLRVPKGRIWEKGHEDCAETIHKMIRRCQEGRGGVIIGEGHFKAKGVDRDKETGQTPLMTPFWMYAVQGAEVEVDGGTGEIRLVRLVGASDVGKAINPKHVLQQIQGGMIQGTSGGIMEEVITDRRGIIVNPNLYDYKMMTTMDMPETADAYYTECANPDGPFGAKGLGEGPVAPGAPCIANAVFDAIGVQIKEAPLTPQNILQALAEKEGAL